MTAIPIAVSVPPLLAQRLDAEARRREMTREELVAMLMFSVLHPVLEEAERTCLDPHHWVA